MLSEPEKRNFTHDNCVFINGKLERFPNQLIKGVSDIITSHLSKPIRKIIHHAQQKNTWLNLQEVAGKLLCLPGKRKPGRVRIGVDFQSQNEQFGQMITFDKYI